MRNRFLFRSWSEAEKTFWFFRLNDPMILLPDASDKIQQCTGVKDGSGTNVFEGDIIEFKYWIGDQAWETMTKEEAEQNESIEGKKFIGLIKQKYDGSCNLFIEVPLEIGTGIFGLTYAQGKGSKVIGNIFEMPELLKK